MYAVDKLLYMKKTIYQQVKFIIKSVYDSIQYKGYTLNKKFEGFIGK